MTQTDNFLSCVCVKVSWRQQLDIFGEWMDSKISMGAMNPMDSSCGGKEGVEE